MGMDRFMEMAIAEASQGLKEGGIPIGSVLAGESETFPGARKFMESQGVEVMDLNLEEPKRLMREFIQKNPALWNEDIGK